MTSRQHIKALENNVACMSMHTCIGPPSWFSPIICDGNDVSLQEDVLCTNRKHSPCTTQGQSPPHMTIAATRDRSAASHSTFPDDKHGSADAGSDLAAQPSRLNSKATDEIVAEVRDPRMQTLVYTVVAHVTALMTWPCCWSAVLHIHNYLGCFRGLKHRRVGDAVRQMLTVSCVAGKS
jgi:hypothetical protein